MSIGSASLIQVLQFQLHALCLFNALTLYCVMFFSSQSSQFPLYLPWVYMVSRVVHCHQHGLAPSLRCPLMQMCFGAVVSVPWIGLFHHVFPVPCIVEWQNVIHVHGLVYDLAYCKENGSHYSYHDVFLHQHTANINIPLCHSHCCSWQNIVAMLWR